MILVRCTDIKSTYSKQIGSGVTLKILFGLYLFFCTGIPTAFAAVVVDNSPDTTGVPTDEPGFSQEFGIQYLGDQFTLLNATNITGGAIFSWAPMGSVSDPVRFVILPDVAGSPGPVPVVDVTTTLDLVDGVLTTSDPNLTRKHASIPPEMLPAGNYWFYLAGDGVDINQATGTYDDGSLEWGVDANPDLEVGTLAAGDTFFTIEGEAGNVLLSVPIPSLSTWALLALILTLTGFGLYTIRKQHASTL